MSTEIRDAAHPLTAAPNRGTPASPRRLAASATIALLSANARYWTTVAPAVHVALAHWRERAAAIGDPALRGLAQAKLRDEAFNAQAGAMLATFAPRSQRANVAAAIVALQVLFDFLDGLSELPSEDPLLHGVHLFAPFTDALRPPGPAARLPGTQPDLYLAELSAAARNAIARLPGASVLAQLAPAIAEAAAQAQIRMHALAQLGRGQLQSWGESRADATGLPWRESVAGSASAVLVLHALVAAAADAALDPAGAGRVERAYLATCALLTLLDGVTDREQDGRAGIVGYVDLYEHPEDLERALIATTAIALQRARALPQPTRHTMILAGVLAYYSSAPGAQTDYARPLLAPVHDALAPLVSPTLAVMRSWRLAKRLRERFIWRSQPATGLS